MELLTGVLAAFYLWTVLRFLLPFVIPDRLAILLYGGVGYGLTFVPWPQALLGMAVAGGAVLLIRLHGTDPERWSWQSLRYWLPRPPVRKSRTGLGHVPGEAPSKVGRRIPRL